MRGLQSSENEIAQATYYNWKANYGGVSVAEVERLKELEAENAKFKRMCADLALLHRLRC